MLTSIVASPPVIDEALVWVGSVKVADAPPVLAETVHVTVPVQDGVVPGPQGDAAPLATLTAT